MLDSRCGVVVDKTKFPFIGAWTEVLRAEAERFRAATGGSA
jgi:hypothetical protein